MNAITDIAFEQIRGNYYWGKYGDFKVIIDVDTGYINATHLCGLAESLTGRKREFFSWKRLDTATDLINEASAAIHICMADLLKTVTGGQITEIRGTYAHPDLIPHIASWASPKFAMQVGKIVNAHLVREYKETIRVKNQNIDEPKTTVNRMEA
jgi:hypothetical protein